MNFSKAFIRMSSLFYFCIGIFLVFSTLKLFLQDNAISILIETSLSPKMKLASIWVVGILGVIAVTLSIVSILWKNQKKVFEFHMIVAITCFFSFTLFEFMSRYAIQNKINPLNNPSLYSNGFCSDDFWKLNAIKEAPKALNPPNSISKSPGKYLKSKIENSHAVSNRFHSIIGWTHARTEKNPEGLSWERKIDMRPKILLYGDSFMEGVLTNEVSIPAFLQKRFPTFQTLNYSSSGYGLDQISLRYKLSSQKYKNPIIIFSALTEDIDRSILSIRGIRKPYFERKPNGDYFAEEISSTLSFHQWLKNNPPNISSYSFAFIKNTFELISSGFDGSNSNCKKEEKLSLNSYLLSDVTKRAKELNHRFIALIFISQRTFLKPYSWRHQFLISFFKEKKIPYIDTKEVIEKDAAKKGIQYTEYFNKTDGHPNERGNQLISDSIEIAINNLMKKQMKSVQGSRLQSPNPK